VRGCDETNMAKEREEAVRRWKEGEKSEEKGNRMK